MWGFTITNLNDGKESGTYWFKTQAEMVPFSIKACKSFVREGHGKATIRIESEEV